ncbi:MAG: hypothetical protein H0X04_00190 [Chthoniobacterales bacterium]|nr:hypothetical protein [Chthoniobacterales bacterium]
MTRAFINGSEGGAITLSKGGDKTFNVIFMGVDGEASNITGKTFSLEVYADASRSAAVVKSHTGTLGGAPTDGRGTLVIVPAGADYGPGTYYAHMKLVTTTGGAIEWLDKIWAVIVD